MDNLKLQTGDVSRILQVSTTYVGMLTAKGVLRAERTASGVRLFDRQEVEKVAAERARRKAADIAGDANG